MIEIRLTEEDALKYLKQQSPDTAALALALKTATEYIDTLEAQQAQFTPIDVLDKTEGETKNESVPSTRVLRDSATAKAFGSAEQLRGKTQKSVESEIDTTNTRWTETEIGVIAYAMARPESELNRTFVSLVHKLNRSENAIRSKLLDLGIVVNKGKLYYK